MFVFQVLVHSPHTKQIGGDTGSGSDISLLNINQTITSLASGVLDPESGEDLLVVGTPTNVLAYDINNNRDLFYKDVSQLEIFIKHRHTS